ncbi:hypothetical protein JCM10207_003249 [Rhodosporidiobolus poonsookiae]
MEQSVSTAQQPPVIQCPYTASNCPLFNPSFSVDEALNLSPRNPPSPLPPIVEAPRPSLVESVRRNSALSVSSSAQSSARSSASDQQESPAVSFFYTNYSIAPAPTPAPPAAPKVLQGCQLPPLPHVAFARSPSNAPLSLRLPSLNIPYSPSAMSAVPLPAAYDENHTSQPAAAAMSPRRPPVPSGMTVPAPAYSSYSAASYPSPGTLVGQGGSYSYERRRESVEDEVQRAGTAQTGFGGTSAADALGAAGIPDAAIAYELAGLASASGSTSASSASRYGDLPVLPPILQEPDSLGASFVGGQGRASPVVNFPMMRAPWVKEESVQLDEDPNELEDEELSEGDDAADGDYVEGIRVDAGKPKRKRASYASSADDGEQPHASSSHVVPHVSAESTTPFISKLYHLLNNPVYSDVIRWSGDGKSILYVHTSKRLLDTLSRFFRHSNLHSFSRQLNIYAFVRLNTAQLLSTLERSPASPQAAEPACTAASEYSGFTHPLFYRDSDPGGAPCDLSRIKPQGPKTEKGRQNLAKKKAEGGKKRKGKSSGKEGDKVGGVRKQGGGKG